MMVAGFVAGGHRTEIAELAVKSRLPVIYAERRFVEAGGLMTYGVNVEEPGPARRYLCGQDSKRREARELAGGAADKFELIINLKAAKQIGPDDSAERVAGRIR